MRVYQPGSADVILAQWWTGLTRDGELAPLFPARVHALSAFLARFQPPTVLLGEADADGLWAALWGTPWLGGATVNLWVRADKRRTKVALRAVEAGVGLLLTRWPVLVATTADLGLRDLYAGFGLQMSETPIPHLVDGVPGYLGWLTADTFQRRMTTPIEGVTVNG